MIIIKNYPIILLIGTEFLNNFSQKDKIMKFGYARVSKNDQSLEVQIQKLTKAGCDEIFQEKVSGSKDDRSQLNLLLSKIRKGDTICVVRLDRLGRRNRHYNLTFNKRCAIMKHGKFHELRG